MIENHKSRLEKPGRVFRLVSCWKSGTIPWKPRTMCFKRSGFHLGQEICKRIKNQNKDPDQLKAVIEKLVAGEKLEPKYRDHQLSGNWKDHRDCHIESDWILIYRIEDEDLILERTGSHSELFKK